MYAATRGSNVKWGGTDFKWGGRAPLATRWRRPCATDTIWKCHVNTVNVFPQSLEAKNKARIHAKTRTLYYAMQATHARTSVVWKQVLVCCVRAQVYCSNFQWKSDSCAFFVCDWMQFSNRW